MRGTTASILFGCALAACGGSSSTPDAPGGTVDAPAGTVDAPVNTPDAGGPFDCEGKPLPTQAPGTITVGGVTESITLSGRTPVQGTMVSAFKNGGSNPLVTATSDANGAYTLDASTGGAPIDGYVLGHRGQAGNINYIDTYLYPPAPLAGNTDKGEILLLSSGSGGTFSTLQSFAGATQTGGKGFVAVIIADCNQMPIAGAKVTTTPGGDVRYNGSSGLPDSGANETQPDGIAYVFNLTPGTVTVGATVTGHTMRAHDIDVRADVITTTVVQP
ncbi:MAG TPA: hypothetical protein VL463_05175 [Kofleriaceae bacterium]|jgi:hypothetical protein|nr:hypothetical protein [Kofleriaceae bacterium]